MKKKIYVILLLLMNITALLAQQKDGTYTFFNSTNSARVAALGGVSLPIYDSDIQLSTFNPSVINPEMNNSMSLSYVNYFSDINFASFQYGHSFEKIGSFVGTIQYHNYGEFIYSDESGNIDNTQFSVSDYAIYLGWGRHLNERLSIGANLKLGGIQYENNTSFALAVDLAATYKTNSNWIFSLAARNIGRELHNSYQSFENELPFRMQVGASKSLEHLPFTIIVVYDNLQKWDLNYDDPLDLEDNYDPITGQMVEKTKIDKFANNLFSHFVFAGELNLGKNLSLRVGYNYGYRQTMKTPTKKGAVGLSYGVGINIYKFKISYSRSEMHIHGSPNYITITTNFNSFKKH